MKNCIVSTIVLVALFSLSTLSFSKNFTTEGNSLRNAVTGTINDKTALFISEIDGAVSCYTLDGKLKWENQTDAKALVFEIVAEDINQDGNSDLLAASADGNIYCWNHSGKLMWKFNPGHKVRFNELAVLTQNNTKTILAGGNDFFLYEIDTNGKQIGKTAIEGTVRIIETGNFIEKDKQSIYLMTYQHDKFRWMFNGFLDAKDKSVIHSTKELPKSWSKFMINNHEIVDLNKNGLDDVLFIGHAAGGFIYGLDGKCQEIMSFHGGQKDSQRYAHGIGTTISKKDQIIMQYGGITYVTDMKGKLIHKSGERHRGIIFNDIVFEPKTNQLLGIGQIGGGNTIYFTSLNDPNWWKKEHQLQGRMAEVEENMDKLYQQTLNFTPPSYQKKSDKDWVMITNIKEQPEMAKLQGADVNLIRQHNWHETFDRSHLVEIMGDVALKRDRRMKYNDSQAKILKEAAELEKAGTPFVAWTGHGNDPFFVSIETMEKILEVAPNTCYGFTYAEMENSSDPRYIYFVDHYVPRLAKALRKHGKAKLYFRYKNIFWAANSHTEPWKRLFFSGKYNDILVPAAEDTNARTQELNFSGRSGMFSAGFVNDFAMRLVDDNPTCWRPHSPGGQRSVSPYLRSGIMYAAYGGRYGLIFPIGYLEGPGMNVLFALMKSGALPIVEKEDILSIGSWHLIKDVDEEVVHGVSSGHDLTIYDAHDDDAVIGYGKLCWAGTNVPDHDYSKMLGVDYRWLNFTPSLPYGMIPVAPIEAEDQLKKSGTPYVVSDWKKGMVNGKDVVAKDFGKIMQNTAIKGASQMPVVVKGASWSAIKLDKKHIRLIMVDPGYIDPQDRDVEVKLQGQIPVKANDILSGKALKIKNNTIGIKVPAGSVRFIDLEYSTPIANN